MDPERRLLTAARELRGPKMITGSDSLDGVVIAVVMMPVIVKLGFYGLSGILGKIAVGAGKDLQRVAKIGLQKTGRELREGLGRLDRLGDGS